MPKKSLKFYERTTAQRILKINLKQCLKQEFLNKLQRVRKLYSILLKQRKLIIPVEDFIPIQYYINFLQVIPISMWSETPIFYYNKFKWDALGFLGERIHSSTHRTKYIQLCFKACKIQISEVLDNEHPLFMDYKNNKERFIEALRFIDKILDEEQLKQIMTKAKILSDESRFTFKQPRRGYN